MTATLNQHDLWAAAYLSEMTEKVWKNRTGKQLEIKEIDGKTYRYAADILLIPELRKYEIRYFDGASTGDLETIRSYIKKVQRDGIDKFWRMGEWASGTRYYVLDNNGFHDSATRCHDYLLRPCTERRCSESYHSWLDGKISDSCSLESIEHPDGYYVVHGCREPDETKWNAWADANGLPDGHAGLKAIRDLANDFAWMQATCDQLNEKEPAHV